MQEDVVDKSIDVAFRLTSLTLDQILKLLEIIKKDMEKWQGGKQIEKPLDAKAATPESPQIKQGKMTLKELKKQGGGLANIELHNPQLRLLNRVMKNSNVDFSCVKDSTGRYTLFFKANNADEMTQAIKRYTQARIDRADKKPIRQTLREAVAAVKKLNKGRDKVKNKDRGAIEK